MKKIETIAEMRTLAAGWRSKHKSIALVPTQGALHAGQAALIQAAAKQADIVVVSIFVNPLQFTASELSTNYPRSLEEDIKLCEANQADALFAPASEEMYPRGYSTYVTEEFAAKPLDGISRPTHFRGITTLTAKLLNIVRPDFIVFGQKTAQRIAVVRKMIADLSFAVDVIMVPTVREADGLAAGVPNRDFTSSQRQESLALSRGLQKAKEMFEQGVRSPDRLIAEVTHILGEHRRVRVIYVSIVDEHTMESVRELVPGKCMLTIAAWVDEVRLIDNVIL